MKIKFQFNSRSSGQDVPEALTIAKKCGGVLDNKLYAIEFDDPQDKNLLRFFANRRRRVCNRKNLSLNTSLRTCCTFPALLRSLFVLSFF